MTKTMLPVGDMYFLNAKAVRKVTRPDQLTGYSWANRASVPTLFDSVLGSFPNPNLKAKDITAFSYDLVVDGSDSTQDYFAGLGSTQNMMNVFRIDNQAKYMVTISSGYVTSTYGAAWTFGGSDGTQHVYFASNTGTVGVFELLLDTVTLDHIALTGTATVVSLGTATSNAGKNDGMSCRTPTGLPEIPFATYIIMPMRRISDSVRLLRCGDKSGTGTLPNPDPVTTAECGAGKYYDPSNDARFAFSELETEYNCTALVTLCDAVGLVRQARVTSHAAPLTATQIKQPAAAAQQVCQILHHVCNPTM